MKYHRGWILTPAFLALAACASFGADGGDGGDVGDAGASFDGGRDDAVTLGALTDSSTLDTSDASLTLSDSASDGGGGDGGDGGLVLPEGILAVSFRKTGMAVSPCGADFPTPGPTLQDSVTAPAATCGCTCAAPANVACSLTLTTSSTGDSTGVYYCPSGLPAPNFVLVGSGALVTYAGVEGPIGTATPAASGGACAPVPSTVTPPPAWANVAGTCLSAAPAPRLSPGPDYKLCLAKPGVVACAPGPYAERHVEYATAVDDRSCSACTCGSVSGAVCGGSATHAADVVPAGFNCFNGPPAGHMLWKGLWSYTSNLTSSGSCPHNTPVASGGVTPGDPTTFCCAP
jgi:hypothetical protein